MTLLTLLWTLSTGYIRKHQTRSALIVLSIALGVATLVATQSLNKGLKASVQDSVNPLANMADLLVGNGQTGVPADLAKRIEKMNLPGVVSATPFIQWRISLPTLDNKVIWLLGVDAKRTGKQDDLSGELEKLGIRGTTTSRLAFDNMPVPRENILGPEGKGLKVALTVVCPSAIAVTTPAAFTVTTASFADDHCDVAVRS